MKKTDRKTAGLLAILLGGIGGQHFYMGNIWMGIICIVFCRTYIPLIIGIIEGIVYLSHSDERWDERYNVVKKEDLKINKDKLYDDLLKFDSLKEKGLIEESEYKEKIKEIKSQIKDIDNQEENLKDKLKKQEEQDKKDKEDIKKSMNILKISAIIVFGILISLYIWSILK